MNMNPRHSLKIYPRVDQGYKAKKSLNFDMMRSAVFIARGDPDKAKFWRWVCYILIGFLTGIIAFLMEQLEEYMVEWRNDIVSIIIEKYATNHTIAQLLAWVFLSAWCFTIGGAASYMTIRFGPGANGSGIAELIAYLNGVNIPMLIGWDTFIIKSLCVVLGIGANLCIGKEGPLAHIGANVAVLLVYSVPLNVFQYYQNDVMKRIRSCRYICWCQCSFRIANWRYLICVRAFKTIYFLDIQYALANVPLCSFRYLHSLLARSCRRERMDGP